LSVSTDKRPKGRLVGTCAAPEAGLVRDQAVRCLPRRVLSGLINLNTTLGNILYLELHIERRGTAAVSLRLQFRM
jgi:hypothetical protein